MQLFGQGFCQQLALVVASPAPFLRGHGHIGHPVKGTQKGAGGLRHHPAQGQGQAGLLLEFQPVQGVRQPLPVGKGRQHPQPAVLPPELSLGITGQQHLSGNRLLRQRRLAGPAKQPVGRHHPVAQQAAPWAQNPPQPLSHRQGMPYVHRLRQNRRKASRPSSVSL